MSATLDDPDSQELLSLELKGKKKKGKKKVDMNQIDAQVADLAVGTAIPDGVVENQSVIANSVNTEHSTVATADPSPLEDLNLPVKKKAKKRPRNIPNEEGVILQVSEPVYPLEPPEVLPSAPAVIAPKPPHEHPPLSYDYVLPVKKKKRRPNITFEGFEEVLAEVGVELIKVVDGWDGEEDMEIMDSSTWAGSDRDYTYDELLERIFNIMRQKNPNMVDRKTKLVMKPPQVIRVGARRTSFANFTEICKLQPKHLLAFLLAELGTNGSIDGNNQLIIKGRFQQKQIETVLRRYIKEYVTCHTCRSPDTNLQRENRLFFLQCGTCGSRCSVENVKSGFQAVTNRRSRQQQ